MKQSTTPDTLGRRIQTLRRAAGMSQEALAAAVGVSRQAIGKWESNLSLPGMDNLMALAEALNVSCDELLTGHPAAQAAQPPFSMEGMQALLDAREKSSAKRLRLFAAAGGAAALLLTGALAFALAFANGRIDDLHSRINQVDARMGGLEGTLQSQTDALANQLREALDEQYALVAGEEHEYSAWDAETGTLLLTARVTVRQVPEGAKARLVLSGPGRELTSLEMAEEGGGIYAVSGRVDAGGESVTATFQLESADGTVQNQTLWQDYDLASAYQLTVELVDGSDGKTLTWRGERGQIRFSGEVGLFIAPAPGCLPVRAEMALEIGGEEREVYALEETDLDIFQPEESGAGSSAQASALSATYFWTPEPQPWQEGQSIRLIARVWDNQGTQYEQSMDLWS